VATKCWSFVSFLVIWYGLCGFPNGLQWSCMFIICPAITYYFAGYLRLLPRSHKFNYGFIFYCFWLVKEILKSSFTVIRIIWSRQLSITPTFEWVEFKDSAFSDIGLVVYGNSITLTPGTVTADTTNGMLLVHALEQSSIEDLHKGEMAHRINKIVSS
jgi:multicomponent Na+:H+ antiporter subunit E